MFGLVVFVLMMVEWHYFVDSSMVLGDIASFPDVLKLLSTLLVLRL